MNYKPSKDGINNLYPNVSVWKWTSNFIPNLIMDVITTNRIYLPGYFTGTAWVFGMALLQPDQVPVPLTLFRSNSKLNQNLQCSGLKYTLPITTTFCTRHDSYTVVTCAKFRCGWLKHLKLEHSKFWSNFEFDRNTASGTGARPKSCTYFMDHPEPDSSFTSLCFKIRFAIGCCLITDIHYWDPDILKTQYFKASHI